MSHSEGPDTLTVPGPPNVRSGAIHANNKHRVTGGSGVYHGRLEAILCDGKVPVERVKGRSHASYAFWAPRIPEGRNLAVLMTLGVICLDWDGREGLRTRVQLQATLGALLPTYAERTPRGGLHEFYATHHGVIIPNSAGKHGPGFDVRSDGGIVVTYPSKGYRRIRSWPGQLPYLPKAWSDMLAAPREREIRATADGTAKHNPAGLVQTLANATEGTRNATLFWAAARLFECPEKVQRRWLPVIRREAAYIGLPDWEIAQVISNARREVTGR